MIHGSPKFNTLADLKKCSKINRNIEKINGGCRKVQTECIVGYLTRKILFDVRQQLSKSGL
jgi:hypothetical protein